MSERESYAINDTLRSTLSRAITAAYSDIKGLVLISTCNRTEIYFESQYTKAAVVRDFFIRSAGSGYNDRKLFDLSDETHKTANRLLQVSNGLQSAVMGDKQIISQVKEAYQFCLAHNQQGSLLERLFQAVFKSHKRIANESHYRRGSTSTAYRSLKLIEKVLGKSSLSDKRILIVGAGEIARDVVSYLGKFSFGAAYITNRTADKAINLANKYGLFPYDWNLVEAGELGSFDAIITAVSNRQHLLNQPIVSPLNQVVVDLGLPMNVHPVVGTSATLYNVDDVTRQVSQSDQLQAAALNQVQEIIEEELNLFLEWVGKGRVRKIIRKFKEEAEQTVVVSLKQHVGNDRQQAVIRAVRKMTRRQAAFLMSQAQFF
ncbi:hypothetical protein JMN32_18970 [Fulvivirga sp. 29W222]|uniref:Glutamyl-tRNA reductase n=1 Tax=Fulvivirga marina TaxID=2494733 RepID=A0A937G1M2_9BACT|nr:hypothetical protein [Fulvivirga marina]